MSNHEATSALYICSNTSNKEHHRQEANYLDAMYLTVHDFYYQSIYEVGGRTNMIASIIMQAITVKVTCVDFTNKTSY